VFGFIAAALVSAAVIVWFGFRYIGSPSERILRLQIEDYEANYTLINQRIQQL